MKYLGSKRRIAKYIMPIILEGRQEGQLYVEPFVGGANSFQHASNPRLGTDSNPYLIACLAAVRDGWIPPETVTEEEYKAIRANKDGYPPELVGFVGFGYSFGSSWFSGYRTDDNRKGRNSSGYIAKISLLKQAPRLRGATLIHSDYQALDMPDNSIVYCDPPYAGTSGYKATGKFDHAAFWVWATELSQRCRVFVSEYTAPDGWQSVWSKPQMTNVDNKKGKAFQAIEHLFKFVG